MQVLTIPEPFEITPGKLQACADAYLPFLFRGEKTSMSLSDHLLELVNKQTARVARRIGSGSGREPEIVMVKGEVVAILCRDIRLCSQLFAVSADASWKARGMNIYTHSRPDALGAGWTEPSTLRIQMCIRKYTSRETVIGFSHNYSFHTLALFMTFPNSVSAFLSNPLLFFSFVVMVGEFLTLIALIFLAFHSVPRYFIISRNRP